MDPPSPPPPRPTLRRRLFRQLDARSWDGEGMSALNTAVVGLITLNLVMLILETEPVVRDWAGRFLHVLEMSCLVLFTLEYLARLWVAGERPEYAGIGGRLRFMVGFYPLIDLVAILPGLLSLGLADASALRALRILRILRYARFGPVTVAAELVADVFLNRKFELVVSMGLILALVLVGATGMYLIEGEGQPETFGSVPRALWWSVITMTTVGYGDAYPVTMAGKVLAAFVALTGVAAVAIPTGIFAASFTEVVQRRKEDRRPTRSS